MADLIRPEDITDEVSDYSHLLDLITGWRPAWHADAACKEAPVEVSWFPTRRDNGRTAKAICAGCLVLNECRAWALAQEDDLDGVWAGMSKAERAVARREIRAA